MLALLFALFCCTTATLSRAVEDHLTSVQGRVNIHDVRGKVGDVVVTIITSAGEELKTFCRKDGSFYFSDVPPGSHVLNVFHMGYMFPEAKIDVSARSGLVRAVATSNRQYSFGSPMSISPIGTAEYFEKRKPFDVWQFVKSPYGIMVVLMVVALVMFNTIDPEEYKQQMEDMRKGMAELQQGAQPAAAQPPAQIQGRRGSN